MGISTLVIVNTAARHLRRGARWAWHERAVLRRLAPAEVALVRSPEEAGHAAREGACAGFGRLISVGDMATSAGFVNGLMQLAEPHRRALKAGFLALGAPDAWCRALGHPHGIDRQLEILGAGHVFPFDVGRVECRAPDGEPVTRHFVTGVALLPAARALAPAGRPATLLPPDGTECHRGSWYYGFAMLVPSYPGFGLVSPAAVPWDGVLDCAWIESGGALGMARRLQAAVLRLTAGFTRMTARELRLDGADGGMAVHADGVYTGETPAVVTVLPRALPVIVEPVASRLREPQRALLAELPGAALAGHFKRAGAPAPSRCRALCA